MSDTRVVDTNVLIVASAADDGSPFRPEATPVQEAALRQQVLDWLIALGADHNRQIVIDCGWSIPGEYRNKLTDQDYGWLMVIGKLDRNEVAWVNLDFDQDGHGVLPGDLTPSVSDLSDRKMVAAALAALNDGHVCKLANACDTDWLDCRNALARHRVEVENIIEEWLEIKWKLKKLS